MRDKQPTRDLPEHERTARSNVLYDISVLYESTKGARLAFDVTAILVDTQSIAKVNTTESSLGNSMLSAGF